MSGDTPIFWLDCDDCSERVFVRIEDAFADGEEEYCTACGALVMVTCDSETPATAVVVEHGGAVVARLRAELHAAENLLAVVHRDGGHHTEREGFAKSCRDGEGVVVGLRAEVERLEAELATLECPGQHWKNEALAHEQRADQAERERDELLAWAEEMGCEMQADDLDGYTPEECSPDHTGRCWPCEAKVRTKARGS